MTKKQLSVIASTALFAVMLLVAFFSQGLDGDPTAPSSSAHEPEPEQVSEVKPEVPPATTTNALVLRAVDGDTLAVNIDGDERELKVRLLGVDTPESVDPRSPVQCFGKEASAFTASLVDGKRVRLDADPQADEVDKYGRLLRNVVLADARDLNALLVGDGYAYAYLSFPLNAVRKAQLKRLQAEAQQAQRGLWSPETCNGKP